MFAPKRARAHALQPLYGNDEFVCAPLYLRCAWIAIGMSDKCAFDWVARERERGGGGGGEREEGALETARIARLVLIGLLSVV